MSVLVAVSASVASARQALHARRPRRGRARHTAGALLQGGVEADADGRRASHRLRFDALESGAGTEGVWPELQGAPAHRRRRQRAQSDSLWTGMCTTPCAVAFRHKTKFADLTGLARIRWNTKVSGFHQIRPIVKLADGTWLVGDRTDAPCATGCSPSSHSATSAG